MFSFCLSLWIPRLPPSEGCFSMRLLLISLPLARLITSHQAITKCRVIYFLTASNCPAMSGERAELRREKKMRNEVHSAAPWSHHSSHHKIHCVQKVFTSCCSLIPQSVNWIISTHYPRMMSSAWVESNNDKFSWHHVVFVVVQLELWSISTQDLWGSEWPSGSGSPLLLRPVFAQLFEESFFY